MKDNIKLDDLLSSGRIETGRLDSIGFIGDITERDKFTAAKQILFGLAVLYIISLLAYIYKPVEGVKILDICTMTFPSLATLILTFYFHDKPN